MGSSPVDVVLEFERRINSRNPAAIASLLTPDSVFVDSLGSRLQGAETLRAAWQGYLNMVPDYSISHEEIFEQGERVALFGSVRGTFSQDGRIHEENFWASTAAWRAQVKNGKIAWWQVFSDNEPIRVIMRKASTK